MAGFLKRLGRLAKSDETVGKVIAGVMVAAIVAVAAFGWRQIPAFFGGGKAGEAAVAEEVKQSPQKPAPKYNEGEVYEEQHNYEKALECYQAALRQQAEQDGEGSEGVAWVHNKIGNTLLRLARFGEAADEYTAALAIFREARDETAKASTMNNLGSTYREQGEFESALVWYGRAMVIKERALGKDHPDTATSYTNMGAACQDSGDYEAALEWYGKALAIKETALGADHPDLAKIYNNIGGVHYDNGGYDDALEWYDKALAITERTLGKGHPDTTVIYNNIGNIHYAKDGPAAAAEWYGKAYDVFRRALGEGHPRTQNALEALRGFSPPPPENI